MFSGTAHYTRTVHVDTVVLLPVIKNFRKQSDCYTHNARNNHLACEHDYQWQQHTDVVLGLF